MIAVDLRPLIGCAVIGALAALGLVYTLDRDTAALPRPTATIAPLPGWADPGITEDDPRWNCLTMGNGTCGPEWVPITDAVAQWEGITTDGCLMLPDETTLVVCPDGTVLAS